MDFSKLKIKFQGAGSFQPPASTNNMNMINPRLRELTERLDMFDIADVKAAAELSISKLEDAAAIAIKTVEDAAEAAAVKMRGEAVIAAKKVRDAADDTAEKVLEASIVAAKLVAERKTQS